MHCCAAPNFVMMKTRFKNGVFMVTVLLIDLKFWSFSTFLIGSFQCINCVYNVYEPVEMKSGQKAGFWEKFGKIKALQVDQVMSSIDQAWDNRFLRASINAQLIELEAVSPNRSQLILDRSSTWSAVEIRVFTKDSLAFFRVWGFIRSPRDLKRIIT